MNLSNFELFKATKDQKSHAKKLFQCSYLTIINPKDIKKYQFVSIHEYGQMGFVTPSDHCAVVVPDTHQQIRLRIAVLHQQHTT